MEHKDTYTTSTPTIAAPTPYLFVFIQPETKFPIAVIGLFMSCMARWENLPAHLAQQPTSKLQ
jgi:hypothetical protein